MLQDLLQLCELQLKDILGNNYHRTKNCSAVFNSRKIENGYYRIRPRADREPFLAYCDMSDGGGWTVIQRRSNGKENFDRKWADYKQGFGQFQGKNDEYWLGNEHIYDLLVREENSLKIDLMDWHGERRYAIYENFQIKNELWVGTYSGNAGDALSGGSNFEEQWSASLSGMPFSTSDKDHDRFLAGNCAQENKCGWWFNRCHAANLNGQYYKTGNYTGRHDNGVVWSTWHGLWYSLKYTAMKIRLPSFVDVGSGNGKSS
uniref:Fibrinogen C-terminal domain-containing protein n=1 Tax=Chelonoidis abingdonii TaxID=106734 RepID=A0A8C0JDJ9_CHEAB